MGSRRPCRFPILKATPTGTAMATGTGPTVRIRELSLPAAEVPFRGWAEDKMKCRAETGRVNRAAEASPTALSPAEARQAVLRMTEARQTALSLVEAKQPVLSPARTKRAVLSLTEAQQAVPRPWYPRTPAMR